MTDNNKVQKSTDELLEDIIFLFKEMNLNSKDE
jgi:hypothetical protein